jgi:hypothetical protein
MSHDQIRTLQKLHKRIATLEHQEESPLTDAQRSLVATFVHLWLGQHILRTTLKNADLVSDFARMNQPALHAVCSQAETEDIAREAVEDCWDTIYTKYPGFSKEDTVRDVLGDLRGLSSPRSPATSPCCVDTPLDGDQRRAITEMVKVCLDGMRVSLDETSHAIPSRFPMDNIKVFAVANRDRLCGMVDTPEFADVVTKAVDQNYTSHEKKRFVAKAIQHIILTLIADYCS